VILWSDFSFCLISKDITFIIFLQFDIVARFAKEISYLFVVNFNDTNRDIILRLVRVLFNYPINLVNSAEIQTRVLIITYHSIRLSWSSLSVGHNTNIVSLHCRHNKSLHFFKNFSLLWFRFKNSIKCKSFGLLLSILSLQFIMRQKHKICFHFLLKGHNWSYSAYNSYITLDFLQLIK
jgi:hypothetical protein